MALTASSFCWCWLTNTWGVISHPMLYDLKPPSPFPRCHCYCCCCPSLTPNSPPDLSFGQLPSPLPPPPFLGTVSSWLPTLSSGAPKPTPPAPLHVHNLCLQRQACEECVLIAPAPWKHRCSLCDLSSSELLLHLGNDTATLLPDYRWRWFKPVYEGVDPGPCGFFLSSISLMQSLLDC